MFVLIASECRVLKDTQAPVAEQMLLAVAASSHDVPSTFVRDTEAQLNCQW